LTLAIGPNEPLRRSGSSSAQAIPCLLKLGGQVSDQGSRQFSNRCHVFTVDLLKNLDLSASAPRSMPCSVTSSLAGYASFFVQQELLASFVALGFFRSSRNHL